MRFYGRKIMRLSRIHSIVAIQSAGFAAVVLLGSLIFAGSTQAQVGLVQEVTNPVKLVPQGDGRTLQVVRDRDNQCRKGKHEGCLLFERDVLGRIEFYLPGSRHEVKNCLSAKNVITKIEVSANSVKGDPEASKGVFPGQLPSPLWLKENAFPALDRSTGVVYEAVSLDVARTQEWITNLNSHPNKVDEADETKSFWYRVTVTACAASKDGTHVKWVSDPRGDNEGRN